MAWGVPRSEVLGRQAEAITEYVYDEDGRLSHTVTTWAPCWLEEDYAWAAAFLRWKAGKCPGCGLDLCDTTAMADGDPVHTYEVPPPRRCHGCDERIRVQDAHKKKGSVREDALLWHINQKA